MSDIKKKNDRMEILPKSERLGGVKSAENKDEAVNLGQLIDYGAVKKVKVYKALISQSGTAAPTVTVIANTLGDIAWTRGNQGSYVGTLTGAFTENKTLAFIGNTLASTTIFAAQRSDANTVGVTSLDSATDTVSDSLLYLVPLTIEVYN